MAVNFKVPFFLSLAVGKMMREQGRAGSIVNIFSIGSISPDPGLSICAMSKAGLIAMTKQLASEWGKQNIRVNAVTPSFVRTRFSQPIWDNPEMLKMLAQRIPLGRIAEPAEAAEVVLFLASDASSYITGQAIIVSGGISGCPHPGTIQDSDYCTDA